MSDHYRHRQDTLRQITDVLGCTVEDLRVEGDSSTVIGGAIELLRLWSAIDSAEGRRRILVLARELGGPDPVGSRGPAGSNAH